MVKFETIVSADNVVCLAYNGASIPLVDVADFVSLYILETLPRVPHNRPNGLDDDDFFVLEIGVPVLAMVLEALLLEDDDPTYFTSALPEGVRQRMVEIIRLVFVRCPFLAVTSCLSASLSSASSP